jgi:heptosyltransferase-1
VPWGQHAVERNRQLAARALHYDLGPAASYGIVAPPLPAAAWEGSGRYAVLIHSTSAADKLWPEHQWIKLADHLNRRGLTCVLPWGSDMERERSERMAKRIKAAFVPARLSLRDAAGLLGNAVVVFGVDTGLSHLAAALGTPTVGIYVATDPAATGLHAPSCARNAGGRGRPPSLTDVIGAERQLMQGPPAPPV